MIELRKATLAKRQFPRSCEQLLKEIVELGEDAGVQIGLSQEDEYIVLRTSSGKDSQKIPTHREYLLTVAAVLDIIVNEL